MLLFFEQLKQKYGIQEQEQGKKGMYILYI